MGFLSKLMKNPLMQMLAPMAGVGKGMGNFGRVFVDHPQHGIDDGSGVPENDNELGFRISSGQRM